MADSTGRTAPAWNNPIVIISMTLILGVFGLILFALVGWDKGGFVADLREEDMARGLITYLFAVTTIGVAIVLVVTALTGGTDEHNKLRFDRGKEVLGLLLGVFGTIVGFYFGSGIASDSSARDMNIPVRMSDYIVASSDSVTMTAYLAGGAAPYEYKVFLGEDELADGFMPASEGWIDELLSIPAGTQPGRYLIRLEVRDSGGAEIDTTTMIEIAAITPAEP